MKKIKILMIAISVIIIIILICIITLKKNNKKEEEEKLNEIYITEESAFSEDEETDFITEKDSTTFFTVEEYINSFVDYLRNETIKYITEDGKYVENEDEKIKRNKYLVEALNTKYIEENKITENNVREMLEDFNNGSNFIATSMVAKYSNRIYIYIVNGLQYNEDDQIVKAKYIVYYDSENLTYSLVPVDETKSDNIEEIALIYKTETIENNNNNYFEYINMDKKMLCASKYFDFYKKMTLHFPKLIYEYLDEEYRNQRYGSFEQFNQYVIDNKERIESIQCKKYLANNVEGDDYAFQYVCKDQFENLYIFDSVTPMDFTIKLDTYTIITDEYKDEYDNGDYKKKVQMCLEKFRLMINNKDYDKAYNLLNSTFKQNNFPEEEAFINFIKANMFEYNKNVFKSIEEENGVYKAKVEFTDIESEENDKVYKWEFIVKLKNNYEFEMSFNIQED